MTLNNTVTLKYGLEVTQGHWKWCHLKAWVRVFTARRVCIAWTMPRGKMFVCPSVCPSHAGILSKRLYISWKFFHIVLVFFHTRRDSNIPTGTPWRGSRMQRGMKKITIFDQYLAFCRKWCKIQIEIYLQWRTNRKLNMVYRTAPFSITLNNP